MNDNTRRVLVVEDDPTFLRFWKRFLASLGLDEVAFLDNFKQAEEILKKSSFSLLISDVILPACNGFELAKLARENNPNIEVLLTTAYGAKLKRFNLRGEHFHLLHKPYTKLSELKRLIQHLVAHEDASADISEESYSDNRDVPSVTEWKL